MTLFRGLFILLLITIVGLALSFAQVGIIAGGSLMISMWYADRMTINNAVDFETFQIDYFDSKIFSNLIGQINEYGDIMSEGYSYGLILLFISLAIVIPLFIISIKMRKQYEFYSGQVLRLHLSSTSITIIFSVMIAISLIFISTNSFIEISKNQITTITLEMLFESENTSNIIKILTDDLFSNYILIITNIFNASYFAMTALFFLLGRISQFVNNEHPNIISETFILVGLFSLAIWVLFFFVLTGIDSNISLIPPEISNPITT